MELLIIVAAITGTVIADLRRVARTEGTVAIYIGNGHAGWEAAVANVLAPGHKALVIATGRFGLGWAETARRMGVDVDVLDRSVAPACHGARPGGIGVRALAEGVRLAAGHPKVATIDFVEVDAEADRDGITLDVMAHLMLSAVAGYAERRQD